MIFSNMFKKESKIEDKSIDTEDIEAKAMSCGGIIQSSFDGGSFSGISKENSINENKGWLFGITSLIANNVAQTNLELYAKTTKEQGKIANYKTLKPSVITSMRLTKSLAKGTDVEVLIDHPAKVLLHNVSNYVDGFNLLYTTQLWLDVTGDCYWYMIKDSDGTPIEIHILNSTAMRVVPNEGQTAIQGYLYKSATNTVSFKADEIVRFTCPALGNKWYGTSPIMAIANTIEKMNQIDKLELAMLKNYGVPPMLLKYKAELTSQQIRQLELEWKRATTNANAGGVKVLNGDVSVEKIAQSISEMCFSEQIITNIKQMALAYGVPYSLIDSSEQKKAGLDQLLVMLSKNCLQPRLSRIEQSLNQQYLVNFDDSGDLFFKFDDTSPENKKNEADIYNAYIGSGVLLKNEVRAILGFEPLEEQEVVKPVTQEE